MRWNEDVFSDYVKIRRPVFFKRIGTVSNCGYIVNQGVKPNVSHILLVEWKWNPPLQSFPRPGNTEIVNRLFQELKHLLCSKTGIDKRLVRLEVFNKPFLMTAQPKEIIAFRNFLNLTKNLRPLTIFIAILFLQKLLRSLAVVTFVLRLVDIALVKQLLQNGSHDILVPVFSRSNEIFIRNV